MHKYTDRELLNLTLVRSRVLIQMKKRYSLTGLHLAILSLIDTLESQGNPLKYGQVASYKLAHTRNVLQALMELQVKGLTEYRAVTYRGAKKYYINASGIVVLNSYLSAYKRAIRELGEVCRS